MAIRSICFQCGKTAIAETAQLADAQIEHTDKCPRKAGAVSPPAPKVEPTPEPEPVVESVEEEKPKRSKRKKKSESSD